MGFGQVDDVHVVTNGRAVGGGIVSAEDLQRTSVPERRLHDQRHEVQGYGPVLSDGSVEPGARGIEVAQTDRAQTEAFVVPRHDPLDDRLALAIGTLRSNGGVLADRKLVRGAVD